LRKEIILTMEQTTVGIIPEDNVEYQVRLGDTFTRPHSEKIYHSLQYAFKPSSIQSQGLLKKAKNEGILELEFLNSQSQDQTSAEHPQHSYYFRGNYQHSKDVDCILIYEGPEKGFRLEKLSGSAKGLKPGPKTSSSISSNVPPSAPVSLTTNGKRNADFDHHVDTKRHSPPAPVVEVIMPDTGKKDEDDSEDESSSGEDEDIIADIENNMEHDEPSPATNAAVITTPTTVAPTEQPSQNNSVFSSDSSSDSSSSSSDSDSPDDK